MEVLKSPIQALSEFKMPEEMPPSVLFIDELSQFVGLMVFTRAKGKDKLSAFAQVIILKGHRIYCALFPARITVDKFAPCCLELRQTRICNIRKRGSAECLASG